MTQQRKVIAECPEEEILRNKPVHALRPTKR